MQLLTSHPLTPTRMLPLPFTNTLSQLSSQLPPHPHPVTSPHTHFFLYAVSSTSFLLLRYSHLLTILLPPHLHPCVYTLLPPVPIPTYTSFLSSACPATSLPQPMFACREALPCTYLCVTGTFGLPAHHAPAPHFPWLPAPPFHATTGYLSQSHPSSCSRVTLSEPWAWATSRFRSWI